MHRSLFTLAALALAATAAQADICRVAPAALGMDGASWADPITLTTALARPACTEIWLRTGAYKSPSPGPFVIDRDVQLYGGFQGHEATRTARSITTAELTQLDGDGLHRVLLLDTTARSIGPGTVLDTLALVNGNAFDTGGGVQCTATGAGRTCSPTLFNVLFKDNRAQAGGGLAVSAFGGATASPTLTNVWFTNNQASLNGGAVNIVASESGSVASPQFHGGVQQNNLAAVEGGAVYILGNDGATASPRFAGTNISPNTAGLEGGAVKIAASDAGQAHPQFSQVNFESNRSSAYGGAISLAAVSKGSASPVFEDSTFQSNQSTTAGGAFYASLSGGSGSPGFERVLFFNNTTSGQGGALYLHASNNAVNDPASGQPLLRNVTLEANHANAEGGALYIVTQRSASLEPRLHHVTLTRNTANTQADALYANALTNSQLAIGVDASILWSNGLVPALNEGNMASIQIGASIVETGICGNGANCAQTSQGIDPQLAVLGFNGGNSRTRLLQPGSPAIDKIDAAHCPPTDQRGVARPQGTACDAGAVERRAAGSYQLTVNVSGDSSDASYVRTSPLGSPTMDSCRASCSSTFAGDASAPSSVLVIAAPSAASPYVIWSGACTALPGWPEVATVTLDADKACNATFAATPGGGPVNPSGPGGATAVPATSFWSLMLLTLLAVWSGASRLRTYVHGAGNAASRRR